MSEVRAIPLRNREGDVVAEALVDAADFDAVGHWRWYMNEAGYVLRQASTAGKRWKMYLHRQLLGLLPGDEREGDHINRDPLDNRRSNLRVVTRAQQNQNLSPRTTGTSRHRGVSWDTALGSWLAQGCVDGRNHFLGHFHDEDEAASAAAEFREQHMSHAVA